MTALVWGLGLAALSCGDEGSPASDWPSSRGDARQTGLVIKGALPATPKRIWTFETKQPLLSAPVIAKGKVVFGGKDGFVRALKVDSGELAWSVETGGPVEAAPLIHAGRVTIGSSDFKLYCIALESGEVLWRHEVDDKILGAANLLTAPGLERPLIVFGCYDNFIYAVDAETGKRAWGFETDNYVNGSPAVSVGGQVVAGGCDGFLYILDKDGALQRKVEIGSYIASSVAIVDRYAYFGHYGNAVQQVDLETGALSWTYRKRGFAFFSAPAVTAKAVFIGGRDRRLHAIARESGEGLWELKTRGKVDAPPVVVGSELIVGSEDGLIRIVNAASGELRWSFECGAPITAAAGVAGGRFFVACEDGRLYAFGE